MIASIEPWEMAVVVLVALWLLLVIIPALYYTSSDERYRKIMGWDDES